MALMYIQFYDSNTIYINYGNKKSVQKNKSYERLGIFSEFYRLSCIWQSLRSDSLLTASSDTVYQYRGVKMLAESAVTDCQSAADFLKKKIFFLFLKKKIISIGKLFFKKRSRDLEII
jgi:hypothetical protein